jgi:DsbC/DsbD-like thiol-disulfide interchange protein
MPAAAATARAAALCHFAGPIPADRHTHDHVSGAHTQFSLHSGMMIAPFRGLMIVATASMAVASIAPAAAQDASAWQSDGHAATRLIAGATVKKADASYLRAGIEIRLDPGWKTYWRYPGDTGIPPTFDFAGSQNVKSAVVRWPAPEQFSDGAGGRSIGYVGDIILPLKVTPANAAAPVTLHVNLNYAVCGTLCVPAKAALELALTGHSTDAGVLDKAARLVPKRVALGVQTQSGLAIRSVHLTSNGGKESVVVDLTAPQGAPLNLFVEGPTPDWALPLPEPVGPADGPDRRFTFLVDGLPPGAKAKGAALTLTAVSGDHAIEVPAHLD